jgi:gluconolactonase
MLIRRRFFNFAAASFALSACSAARIDDEPDIVAPGGLVTQIAGGFTFTEGPAADKAGNVYFSDIYRSRIYRWSLTAKLSTFRVNSGGANGLMFDRAGNLLACEGVARRVTSTSPSGRVTVLADNYGGKKFNSPNDLWVDPKGGVYFSDPRSGNKSDLKQDGFHVYYITPDRKRVERVVDNLAFPNGVVGTADGRQLYVADSNDRKTYVYSINKDGSLSNRRLAARGGSDGLTLDEQGNLYLTREKNVLIYNRSGRRIAAIDLPDQPSNVTFGGRDKKTLFITAVTRLYSIEMNVRGQ